MRSKAIAPSPKPAPLDPGLIPFLDALAALLAAAHWTKHAAKRQRQLAEEKET